MRSPHSLCDNENISSLVSAGCSCTFEEKSYTMLRWIVPPTDKNCWHTEEVVWPIEGEKKTLYRPIMVILISSDCGTMLLVKWEKKRDMDRREAFRNVGRNGNKSTRKGKIRLPVTSVFINSRAEYRTTCAIPHARNRLWEIHNGPVWLMYGTKVYNSRTQEVQVASNWKLTKFLRHRPQQCLAALQWMLLETHEAIVRLHPDQLIYLAKKWKEHKLLIRSTFEKEFLIQLENMSSILRSNSVARCTEHTEFWIPRMVSI